MKWTGNYIGDKGAVKISESLMTNTTLTELNLSCDDNIIKNIEEMIYKEIKKKRNTKMQKIEIDREQYWRWRSNEDKLIIND